MCPAVSGLGKSKTFCIFLVDIDKPYLEISFPQYSTFAMPNLHLLGLRNMLCLRKRFKTSLSLAINCLGMLFAIRRENPSATGLLTPKMSSIVTLGCLPTIDTP